MNDQQVAFFFAGQALTPAAQQSLQAIRAKKVELAAIAVAQQARTKTVVKCAPPEHGCLYRRAVWTR